MDGIKTKERLVFSKFCPYLKRTILLTRNTWHGHIVIEHPHVSNRLDLIEQTLLGDGKDVRIYQRIKDHNRVALFKECSHFRPFNKYLKIALLLVGDSEAEIRRF